MSATESPLIREPSTHRSSRLFYALMVTAIFAAAAVTRFVALEQYPPAIQQDELSNIFDGYSIAMTGADRHGDRYPFILRAMGPNDYRPALYAYLAAISTKVFGFSTWSGRLPAAIVGLLTVVIIFLFARRLLGRWGGLIALGLAAFSPILIQYSRHAHEGASLPQFFSILIVYLLYRALLIGERPPSFRASMGWLLVAGLVIGFSTNAYAAQRLTAPLTAMLAGALVVWRFGCRERSTGRVVAGLFLLALTAGLGAMPQLHAMLNQPDGFFARAGDITYDWRSGPRWWAVRILTGYAAHFDPRHLFLSVGWYAELTVARLNIAALPFFYVGCGLAIWRWIRQREAIWGVLIASVMICILPAIVTQRNDSIVRASGVWSLYPMFCALGAVALGSMLRPVVRPLIEYCSRVDAHGVSLASQRIEPRASARAALGSKGTIHPQRNIEQAKACSSGLMPVLFTILFAAMGTWHIQFALRSPQWPETVYQRGLVDLGEALRGQEDHYDRIYVETAGVFPYLYVAAYSGMDPQRVQDTAKAGTITRMGWEEFERIGKFRFSTLQEVEAEWAVANSTRPWLFVDGDGKMLELLPVDTLQTARMSPRRVSDR